METQNNDPTRWAQRLASDVGDRVRARRQELALSAQVVADRTALLGHEVKRSVIAEMENGRRATLPVADVLVLAQALNMPPIMLLFPLGDGSPVEIRPGESVEGWQVFDWFAGREQLELPEPWSEYTHDDLVEWRDAVQPITTKFQYDELLTRAKNLRRGLREAVERAVSAPPEVPRIWMIDPIGQLLEQNHEAMEDLVAFREAATSRGWSPPLDDDDIDRNPREWQAARAWLDSQRGGEDYGFAGSADHA